MKKIDITQSIQVLANIGVIAGIFFVAMQLRQNNLLLTAESIGTVFENRIARQDRIMDNPVYTALVVKNRRGEELSEEDEEILRASLDRAFIAWQREYLLYQLGVLPDEYLRASFGAMRSVFLSTQGTLSGYDRWQEWKDSANPAYQVFIEQCIFGECEEIPR